MLGLTCDPATGAVLGIDTGMMMLELGAPLLRNGWTGTLLFCDGISLVADTSAPATARVALQRPELANLLSGRRADLGFSQTQVDIAPITLAEAGIDKNLADRARRYRHLPRWSHGRQEGPECGL